MMSAILPPPIARPSRRRHYKNMEAGSINATGKGELLEDIERGEQHCRADLIYLPVNVFARRLILQTLQRWAPLQAKTTFFGATLMVKWS